jgi:hypothetical protein
MESSGDGVRDSISPLCCSINGILVCNHCGRHYCSDHADKHLYVPKNPTKSRDQFVDCLCGAAGEKRWTILPFNMVRP